MNWYHLRERLYAFFTGKKPRRKRFNFEVHLIDSCNLNCKGCVHFAPLAKPSSFYPLEEFEKEIKRLSELFGGRFGWIHIMGGEPLLNPNINDYLDVVGKYIHDGDVYIITNGLLLEKKDDSFFAACKRNRIRIAITIYPIAFDYEKAKQMVISKGCQCEIFASRLGDKGFSHISLREKPTFDYKKTFIGCDVAYACVTLHHGNLYSCSTAAYAPIYNEHFGEKTFDNSRDSISIFDSDAKTIVDFLRTPHPFCAHCDLKRRKRFIPWNVSRKNKDEWIIEGGKK